MLCVCVCVCVCVHHKRHCVKLTVVHVTFRDQILMNVVLQLVVLLAVSIPASIPMAATTAYVTMDTCWQQMDTCVMVRV